MLKNFDQLPDLDLEDYKPLYVQISEAVSSYILQHGLKAGDPLPSESDLIQRYGVSRMTVRLAIQRLATEGVLEKVQGRGTFVAQAGVTGFIPGIDSMEKVQAAQGNLIRIEPLEAGVCAKVNASWLRELNLPADGEVFRVRKLKIGRSGPVAIEVRFLPLDVASRFNPEDFGKTPVVDLINSLPETEAHRVVYRIRGEILSKRDATMLETSAGAPAIAQMATYFTRTDQPVLTGKVVILSERMELLFEFFKHEKNWDFKREFKQLP